MRIIPAAAAVTLCLFLNASPQTPDSVVSVRTIAPVESLKAGQPAVIGVELSIAKPYHINADRPLEDYLIPTSLEFEPIAGVAFGKVVFPVASVKKLPVSDLPMAVFEGVITISTEITPDASLQQKDIILKGKVRYQACDDRACLPPVRKPFSFALSFHGTAQAPMPQSSPAAASEGFGDRGILVTLLLVFLGGLALNLTPCVYPMIPITISYFGGQSQGKKGSLVGHACLYVIGMAVTYSVLGVFAAMTGSLFGAAHQYPPVLIGIALVMILLALSMFDVYEFRMPAFLNRLAGGSQKGFAGTFLMGLTVGIVAAPCIGPFVLGLLTYVGNKGNAFLGFVLFFVLALGMGVPFIVLGVFSGSINKLPRSGAWMVWVRKVFGFILLAMAVYFLEPLFLNPLAYRLTLALILLLAGIYLAWIDRVESTRKAFLLVRNISGILFFALALYAAVTGIENFLRNASTRTVASRASNAIQWFPYSQAMLGQAAREGKPVFIDFYADWCVPCKEMDTQTFAVPEVVTRSKDFIMLKVDLTSTEDPRAEALREKYQVKGVPTFVFLRSTGQEISDLRGTGFESKDVILKKMSRVLELKADR
jgi:thioredoxin:protein disulfide reductase